MTPKSLLSRIKFKTTHLNRKVIIGLAGLLFFVFLVILFSALTSSPERGSGDHGMNVANTGSGGLNALGQLPNGYSASAAINAMLQNRLGNTISPQLQSLINGLQSQQSSLEAQLAALRQARQPPPQVVAPPVTGPDLNDPLAREAITSSIFFSGGAPSPQNQNQQNQQQGQTGQQSSASKTSGPQNAYSSQNMQGQKSDFLSTQPSKDIYNTNGMQTPISQYILQAGTIIPAILQSQINTNIPGHIIGVVDEDVYDSINGQYLLIPRGSKLIGDYNSSVSYGQYQVQAKFERIVRPDGTSIVLPNEVGVDSNGVAGFSDTVDNHWGQIIGAAVLSTIFNIPSVIATNQLYSQSSVNGTYPPVGSIAGSSALQSAGQSVSQIGSQIASQSLNIQPTIIVHAGYEFSVMVTKDIVLTPYTGSSQSSVPSGSS